MLLSSHILIFAAKLLKDRDLLRRSHYSLEFVNCSTFVSSGVAGRALPQAAADAVPSSMERKMKPWAVSGLSGDHTAGDAGFDFVAKHTEVVGDRRSCSVSGRGNVPSGGGLPLRSPGVVGNHALLGISWLAKAKSVLVLIKTVPGDAICGDLTLLKIHLSSTLLIIEAGITP